MQKELNPPAAEQLLRTAYEFFERRKIEQLLELMHPDVDWPNAVEGGRLRGRDAVRSYWEAQFRVANPSVTPTSFSYDERGRTIVAVHQVVKDLGGKILLDRPVKHAYTIEGGLIRRMDIDET